MKYVGLTWNALIQSFSEDSESIIGKPNYTKRESAINVFQWVLTSSALGISEGYIKIKINLNFYV